MSFDIASLKYGNPNAVQKALLDQETYLDELLSDIIKYPPTTLVGDIKDELNKLVRAVDITMNNEEWENRYVLWDKSFLTFFKTKLIQGVEKKDQERIIDTVENIVRDTIPLLLKIKYHFNRPRPYQFASYFNIPLYPYPSNTDDSPSYISGHAFQSRIICEVLGNYYPENYNLFLKMAKDIANSRYYLGLHFQSDIEMAEYSAKKVLTNREFMLKYNL
jgi:hypothetical protein